CARARRTGATASLSMRPCGRRPCRSRPDPSVRREAWMTSRILLLVASLLTAASPLPAQTIDPATARIVDLTHPMDERTLYWPTSPSAFELKELSYGRPEGGYFYSSYAFCTPEHGGTHLDAPIHFAEGGRTAGEIPVSQLVGPAVVIDITRQ